MLTKQEYINYWLQTARDSWDTAEYLYKGKKFPEALFLFCLAIEKWLKAHWVKDNVNNYPPRIHDLHSLYAETSLELEAEQLDFMDTVNRWNMEGRYPDYRFTLKKIATEEYMSRQLQKLNILKECLLEKI
ncbi:MAG: HEPN domain-containing protein [Bacteroidota bacterium]|nr:HEPN domain-containing protein [Bacteroidota bacterium]